MEEAVRSFNKLPRPKQTPTGLPNHGVFGFSHVDISPPGDIVMAVHPKSRYLKQGGTAQILSLKTVTEKTEAIIPGLLGAFSAPDTPPLFAPWTWATRDSDLAQAVEDALKTHGVKPELCQVATCSDQEWDIFVSVESDIHARLKNMFPQSGPSSDGVEMGDFHEIPRMWSRS